jgi:hypothetical protein
MLQDAATKAIATPPEMDDDPENFVGRGMPKHRRFAADGRKTGLGLAS